MKIIKIIQNYRNASDEEIREFINRNMAQEMITGLEYDDPQTIKRALKLFGIDYTPEPKPAQDAHASADATSDSQVP